jgi:hypothetical protein
MQLYQILLIILGVEILLHLVIGVPVIVGFGESWNVLTPMPKDLKDNTEMNWFGCIICFILLFLMCPLFYIPKIIYWICHI